MPAATGKDQEADIETEKSILKNAGWDALAILYGLNGIAAAIDNHAAAVREHTAAIMAEETTTEPPGDTSLS